MTPFLGINKVEMMKIFSDLKNSFAYLLMAVSLLGTPTALAQKPTLTYLNSFSLPDYEVDGLKVNELSDLAWDEDEQLLYAVSDRGMLFQFKIELTHDAIKQFKPIHGMILLDRKGKKVDWRDAEGLDVLKANNGIKGDTELVIALEGVPRVGRFTPQGQLIAEYPLPKALRDPKSYRARNTMLESVTWHPKWGYITAPEQSLKNQPITMHTLYSRKKHWSFPAYPATNSAITALQTLPNGNLLVLERAWSGVMNPLVISLRYLDFQRCDKTGQCPIENVSVLSSLFLVDNFEGLTHVRDNLYLMVSDDNQSRFQRTLITLFRLELPTP
ncbi:esterase-like activity of phytase family protein [Thiofilum flexile]|uniref:esterase-like activity of phytase family protein n=1 Tax=Thiofilum flexile TaxID=125627 RepID=UPI0003793EFD|nr:esterase-like activity of phytase family protein [Thiofilum flexile]